MNAKKAKSPVLELHHGAINLRALRILRGEYFLAFKCSNIPSLRIEGSRGGPDKAEAMKTLSDIQLDSADREAIETSAKLVYERFPVSQVILFGSKARGADDQESDIDLLLLTRRPLDWRERDAITDSLFEVELAYEVVISTLVLPAEEWERGPYTVLPIHREISREGVLA